MDSFGGMALSQSEIPVSGFLPVKQNEFSKRRSQESSKLYGFLTALTDTCVIDTSKISQAFSFGKNNDLMVEAGLSERGNPRRKSQSRNDLNNLKSKSSDMKCPKGGMYRSNTKLFNTEEVISDDYSKLITL